jgi:hypothetical protein
VALAQVALATEAEALDQPQGALVAGVDVGLEAMETEPAEGVTDQQRQRLAHQAAVPGGEAEGEAEPGTLVGPVKVSERAGADDRSGRTKGATIMPDPTPRGASASR